MRGLKSDAEKCLLDRVRGKPNLTIATGKAVRALMAAPGSPARLSGVECEDGTRYEADAVMLAAGALHSPRLLQSYLEMSGLAERLPAYRSVGRNYKFHVLTAMLALSHRPITDVLSKTLLLTHDAFPHSTLQTLGGSLARQILLTQAPGFVPSALVEPFAQRAVGLFLQTEDGSHPDQRVLPPAAGRRRRRSTTIRALARSACRAPAAHAHAAQSAGAAGLSAGDASHPAVRDRACVRHAGRGQRSDDSVVDAEGRVHGLDNLYVVDGSVLPRSSRVNPALTIYAWALRVASRLESSRAPARVAFAAATI